MHVPLSCGNGCSSTSCEFRYLDEPCDFLLFFFRERLANGSIRSTNVPDAIVDPYMCFCVCLSVCVCICIALTLSPQLLCLEYFVARAYVYLLLTKSIINRVTSNQKQLANLRYPRRGSTMLQSPRPQNRFGPFRTSIA